MANSNHSTEIHHEEGGSGGLPQLNPDSFASQLFWLAVVFAALYLMMARSVLPRIREVLMKRESQIQHDLDTAEKAKLEAEAARKSYEADLASAKQQSADLFARTQREIDSFLGDEQKRLQESLDAIITDSQKRIAEQRAKAMEEIKPIVQELTGLISSEYLPKAPTKTAVNKAMKEAGADA